MTGELALVRETVEILSLLGRGGMEDAGDFAHGLHRGGTKVDLGDLV